MYSHMLTHRLGNEMAYNAMRECRPEPIPPQPPLLYNIIKAKRGEVSCVTCLPQEGAQDSVSCKCPALSCACPALRVCHRKERRTVCPASVLRCPARVLRYVFATGRSAGQCVLRVSCKCPARVLRYVFATGKRAGQCVLQVSCAVLRVSCVMCLPQEGTQDSAPKKPNLRPPVGRMTETKRLGEKQLGLTGLKSLGGKS